MAAGAGSGGNVATFAPMGEGRAGEIGGTRPGHLSPGDAWARLDDDARIAVEMLAVAGPLDLTVVSRLVEPGALAALEVAGLVRLAEVAGTRLVGLDDTLAGAATDRLGPLARRGVAARVADALDDPVGGDPGRAARLRLDHALALDPEVALEAARTALKALDPLLALRFAERAGRGFEALLIRGAAHATRGDVEAAETALRAAVAAGADEADRARAVSRLANMLVTAAGRFDDAIGLLERTIAGLTDPHWADFLRADLVYSRAWTGAPVAAPSLGTAHPAARGQECLVGAVVTVMQGELEATHRFVTEGLALLPALEPEVPAARDLLTLSRFLALAFAGAGEASRRLVAAELERAAARSDVAAGTWFAVRAMQRLFDGDAAGAIADADRALDRLAVADIGGLHPMTLAVRAIGEARLGDVAASVATRAQIPEPWRVETKVRALSLAAEGWCVAASGDDRGAAERFVTAGRRALDEQHAVFGAFLAYEAVRIGAPRWALPVLRAAAERCSGSLVSALREHGEALAAGDAERLLAVAAELPDVGFTVGGAEAAAQAADRFTSDGDLDRAAHARYLAAATLDRIPGAPSRATRHSRGLTRREAEIAALAAEGWPSRKIADQLGISARTVDNHLASVYRKLGVPRRAHLRTALARPTT